MRSERDTPGNAYAVLQTLKQQKVRAIDRLIISMTLLAFIGAPVSVSRAFYVGWNETFTLHLAALVVAVLLSLFRSRLSLEFKVWVVLSTCLLISLLGMFAYGFVGNGLLWGGVAVLISTFFLNNRHTYLVIAVIFTVFGVTGFQFIYGGKVFPGGADLYLSELSSWGTALVGGAMFIVLIAYLSAGFRRQQNDLLVELENKNRELDAKHAEISRLANYDDLTGLPVLRQFRLTAENALLRQRRENRFIALCFIDLDGFKAVNDNHGHDAGDFVLRSVAQRLSANIRQLDMLSRMGGDEFIILLNSDEPVDLEVFCSRLLQETRKPYIYAGAKLDISISIGVACASQNSDFDALLKASDNAMYEAKRQGRDRYLIATS